MIAGYLTCRAVDSTRCVARPRTTVSPRLSQAAHSECTQIERSDSQGCIGCDEHFFVGVLPTSPPKPLPGQSAWAKTTSTARRTAARASAATGSARRGQRAVAPARGTARAAASPAAAAAGHCAVAVGQGAATCSAVVPRRAPPPPPSTPRASPSAHGEGWAASMCCPLRRRRPFPYSRRRHRPRLD